jgi:hypothetical protein
VSLPRPPGLVERHGEPSEDGQVGVESHSFQPADPEGQERPFVLQPAEFAFDGSALVVQGLEAGVLSLNDLYLEGVAADQAVQRVDPVFANLDGLIGMTRRSDHDHVVGLVQR